MAAMDSTAPDPNSMPAASPPHARWWQRRWVQWALAILLILAALFAWHYPSLKAQADAGSAYAARIGCSCRYVQGRGLESCKADFEPGMEIVSVADDADAKAVTGSVPLISRRTARFKGASGCILDPVD
jgi:hypothetical protein